MLNSRELVSRGIVIRGRRIKINLKVIKLQPFNKIEGKSIIKYPRKLLK